MYCKPLRRYTGGLFIAIFSLTPLILLGNEALAQNKKTMTTPKENKAFVQRVMEDGVNKGDIEFLREVMVPNYARHSQATTEMPEIRGREQMIDFFQAVFGAFPDWHEEIELMVAEDDKVAYITTGTGTHTGPWGDLPITGKKVKIVNFIVHRIQNGKIAETWTGWDNVAFLAQIGLFPPPGANDE
jgi:steroid delta-isomerase-like uncharacterized protein